MNFSVIPTADGSLTLKNSIFAECYHSVAGAYFEAKNLYIKGSGIELAFNDKGRKVKVLDIGLGLGYNALATIESWWNSKTHCDLEICSIEIDAELFQALKSGRAPWQDGWSHAWLSWATSLNDKNRFSLNHPDGGQLLWNVYIADARECLTAQDLKLDFDYVWHDSFSREKLPELWTDAFFKLVRSCCKKGSLLMTYSVARSVRDSLITAGFNPQRFASGSTKKHWLRAVVER